MKKLLFPLALLLVVGSCVRVHQRESDNSNLVQEESSTTPKIVMPDLGIDYKQEVTCNNYKRLQLDFKDDLKKLILVVDKVPDFISMLKAIKTVLEIIVDQFSTTSSSFIQTSVHSDISKLEKELFTFKDLEFLTFDQQTQRIIRDISDALRLIKQDNKDNKPMITACNRVISEIDFMIDYWGQVKSYVEKELINTVFTARKYKLDNAHEVCTHYILEEGQIEFEVPAPYQISGKQHYYSKVITFAKKHTGTFMVGLNIVEYVADSFQEGKPFSVSVHHPTSRKDTDKHEFTIVTQNGGLLSLKIRYYLFKITGSSHMTQAKGGYDEFILKLNKEKYQGITKRAIKMGNYYYHQAFTNKYGFESKLVENKNDFVINNECKEQIRGNPQYIYYVY